MTPLEKLLAKLEGVTGSGGSFTARCPSHEDKRPSLAVSEGKDGRVLVKCHANCETADVLAAVGLELKDLFAAEAPASKPEIVECYDYTDEGGQLLYQVVRFRRPKDFRQRRPDGSGGWIWSVKDTRRVPYRLPQVIDAVKQGRRVFVVEGEKDVHALERLGFVATTNSGGAGKWLSEHSQTLTDAHVVIIPDDGTAGREHAEIVSKALEGIAADVTVIYLPGLPEKGDVSDWIDQGGTADQLKEMVKNPPAPYSPVKRFTGSHPPSKPADRTEDGQEATGSAQLHSFTALEELAAPVIADHDPLKLVETAIKSMGYGGEIRIPLIVYLAATSRLLKMRRGSMPVHLLLVGQPSAGKSYAATLVTATMPPSAVYSVDAASSRVLIYDEADFKHRVIFFGEADSLPSSEDNPAASAVRNLLQEHRLNYDVVERGKGGAFHVRKIEKEGPSVLITTAVKRLGEQLTSRLFVLDVPDDQKQIRAALTSQAAIELEGQAKAPDPALVAFQGLLQLQAPHDVVVPFADRLADAIGQRPAASRINRDFARLLSLVKSLALLRKYQRQTNGRGQIIAEIADYETVYELTQDMFAASVSGAGQTVRETIETVADMIEKGREHVSVVEVAERLGVSTRAASGRVKKALHGGWLVNREERKGRPYKLAIGDPLPASSGLPEPEEVRTCEPPENGGVSSKCGHLQGREPVNPETVAREELADMEQGPPPLHCGHPESNAWRLPESDRWRCGVCHPPAGADAERAIKEVAI